MAMARASMIPVALLFAAAAVVVLAGPVGAEGIEQTIPISPQGTSTSRGRPTTPAGLAVVEEVLVTTAKEDFGGREAAYQSAVKWQNRLLSQQTGQGQQPAPYLACFEYGDAREAMDSLERLLPEAASIRRASLREQHGACFLVTLESPAVAAALAGRLHQDLRQFDPFPSALKLAPGLLNHNNGLTFGGDDPDALQDRLSTKHGARMRGDSVAGIVLELSPGVLPAHDPRAGSFISDLKAGLLVSTSMDLQGNNFWSDPTMLLDGENGHQAHPAGALRAREWGRAAGVLHALSADGGTTPGDVCSWGGIQMHHSWDDVLHVTGLDHLLEGGRGAGGSTAAESEELQMACFMGLVSHLASQPQVLRVAPYHRTKVLNAVAKAISQSADITDTPLTDAGLDGSGEIIQVVDSGLDQESCFFRDEDGENVELGYYFDEIALLSATDYYAEFNGGYFPADLNRRKVVQYIGLLRQDVEGEEQPYGDYYTTAMGLQFPWYDAEGFAAETPGGHGSHTAGTAAGVMIDNPAELDSCGDDEELGCVGGCFESTYLDDLLTDDEISLDALCPAHNCDNLESYGICLDEYGEGDDAVTEALKAHSGVAAGAKIAVFDVSVDGVLIWAELAMNGLWDAVEDTGCVVHTNSWGGEPTCETDTMSTAFDEYMYENPEHLLIFAAGNSGDATSTTSSCTMGSPAIGKNVLAVGSSSSGETRWTSTLADGGARSSLDEDAGDIDTVSWFSSNGPTLDNRIKPELVAPGDGVISVSSAADTDATCRLEHQTGSSMASPVVAASAAMVRQYFKNSIFYVADAEARELCPVNTSSTTTSTPLLCEEFDPSAATTKAILINSANLMGGSSEPDGFRGFGRVHLEAGVPLNGSGYSGLFVVDSNDTSISQDSVEDYTFELSGDKNVEFRATLAWIDPAASTLSSAQLVHDLDLTVISPSGVSFTMWSTGVDSSNVVERVIVSADDVAAEGNGTWTVSVSANVLSTESQAYSLVVSGPFGKGTAIVEDEEESSSAVASRGRGRGTGAWFSMSMSLLARAGVVLASGLVAGALLA